MNWYRFRQLHQQRPGPARLVSAAAAAALVVAGLFATGVSGASAAALPTGTASLASIAARPPMGFNDWLSFHCNVDERLMTSVADAFVSEGLRSAGYTYVNVDDCWEARSRDAAGNLQADPAKFPHGIKWLADYVHQRGLKFGIYSAASATTCQKFPGSAGHYTADMQTFASWGVDYLKLDLCGSEPNTLIKNNCANTVASQNIKARYDQAARAIRATGRPMILAVSAPASIAWWCGYDKASYQDAMSWAPQDGQLWRTAVDAGQSWTSILATYSQNVKLGFAQSKGHWNDADMLVAGSSRVTLTEQQTQFTLWAEMAAPLLISTNLAKISPQALAILSNQEVIAVDQDKLGVQGHIVQSGTGYDVLSKPLSDHSRAVVLFNMSNAPITIATTALTAGLPSSPHYRLTDLVSKQSTTTTGSISATVAPHGTVIYRVAPTT